MRQRITATATVFFHRFYVVPPNGLCNTDPCLVATACLYVAAKVEETPLHVRSVHHEAAKMWLGECEWIALHLNRLPADICIRCRPPLRPEYGHSSFPASSTDLAEMEFYLLRDLGYHLILHHPYRPLMSIVGTVGKAALDKAAENEAKLKSLTSVHRSSAGSNTKSLPPAGLGLQADTLGVGSSKMPGPNTDMAANSQAPGKNERLAFQLEEELARAAMTAGDHGLPVARAEELDQDVVQMAWFLLNDTYRHPMIHLLYPPYIMAIASIYLALVLHEKSREKLLASTKRMEERRRAAEEDRQAENEARRAKRGQQQSNGDSTKNTSKSNDSVPSTAKRDLASSGATSLAPAGYEWRDQGGAGHRAPLPTATATATSNRGFSSLPPRPAHLPPRPGSTSISSLQSPRGGAMPTPPRSPSTSVDAAFGGPQPSPLSSSSATGLMGANRVAPQKQHQNADPTPPPDILTFLAALNLSPTSQLAACIQHMLDGYATWAECQREIEGVEGSKRVLGWLEDWRRQREEELRVLDLEKASAEAEAARQPGL